eukprot:scaffold16890_cov110-Isochrysis_galbana.AAC.5
MRLGDGAGNARTNGAVDVGDGHGQLDVLVLLNGPLHIVTREELVVESVGLRPRLGRLRLPRAVGGHVGHLRDERQVQMGRLVQRPVALLEQVGEDLPRLLRDVQEEAEHVVGHADKLGAQGLLLRGHSDRAVVGVADARHHAADGDHGDCAEAKLVRAQHRAHHDVVARLEPAVDAQHDAVAQLVDDERLVRLGEAELPRAAGVLDGGKGRGAGAAVVARDLDDVGVRLGDARRHRADANLADQLDRNLGGRVDLVQVVDELRQVLDRVDVVVGRRRDEHHPALARANGRDVGVHLGAGQLAALAGLGALRDLNLDLLGRHEVGRRDAKAAGGHLLDLGDGDVAVLQALEVREGGRVAELVDVVQRLPARLVLAALARVGPAARAVDANGERLVRLARERAERHAAGGEALHNGLDRLHLVQRDGLAVRHHL